ncbi:MAG: DUF58 domain-containing protein [Acidobacteriia bacterium]|nr:DUF58 domain-containing protein [Terriglobia bacterium]
MALKKPLLPAWGYFLMALTTLLLALLAALASRAAALENQLITAALLALVALGLAGLISMTVVPSLARRARREWRGAKILFKVSREGWIYFGVTVLIGLSAVNTGNNLLFIVLSTMLGSIVISGVASRVALRGLQFSADLPERLFARQASLATVTLANRKRWLPSFSISVEPALQMGPCIAFERIYFPFLPPSFSQKRRMELVFSRRGKYSQSRVRISTRFPFGFITKWVELPQPREVIVFPSIEPVDSFYEILPLISGEFESYLKGRGMDLYAVRDYSATDSARTIHWKATARAESLKVKEFAREDERRLMLIFDAKTDDIPMPEPSRFERAVTLCACLAHHFLSEGADLSYLREDGTLLEGTTEETLDEIYTELALLEMSPGPSRLMDQVESLPPDEKDSFKIVFTLRERGTLPTRLWESSHVLFIREGPGAPGNPAPVE